MKGINGLTLAVCYYPEQVSMGKQIGTNGEMSHVGLYNTFHRLKMIYGDDAVFRIESELGVGTTVEVRIGLGRGENNHETVDYK